MASTAKQLGLHESHISAWRKKARYVASRSETEKYLAAKNVRLKHQYAKAAKIFKATTNSGHSLPVAPNHLEQDFTADASNRKWVCDFTYPRTHHGWLYLTIILDQFSCMVAGWAMGNRMKAQLVYDALQMACGGGACQRA